MTPVQTSLFGDTLAQSRRSDPPSSKVSARSVDAARQRRLIIEHLAQQDATADDLAPIIGRHRSHASTRLTVLKQLGHAYKIGTSPRRGETGAVRDVDLWRITDAGREWLAEVHRADAA